MSAVFVGLLATVGVAAPAHADGNPLAQLTAIVNPPPQPNVLDLCITSRSFDPKGTCIDIPSPATASAPVVFVCHATATVDNLIAVIRDFSIFGDVQGTGTCQSLAGTWQVTLSGQFGSSLEEPCPAGTYQFTPLKLTDGTSTLTPDQFWDVGPASGALDDLRSLFGVPVPTENAGDSQTMVVYDTPPFGNGIGVGAGHIQSSTPCAVDQAPFQVTADWVFTANAVPT